MRWSKLSHNQKSVWLLRVALFFVILFAILSGLYHDLYQEQLEKTQILEEEIRNLTRKQ